MSGISGGGVLKHFSPRNHGITVSHGWWFIAMCRIDNAAMATMTDDQVRNDALQVLNVWKTNPQFQLADLTVNGMETLFNDYSAILQKRLELAQSLADIDMHLEGHRETVREACIRSRAGFKGFFGRNSNQYSLVGGTRLMDRKAPRRAAAGTTDATTETAK